ncbi:hypothetical protein GCM10023195_39590 [Actinoallomurus liliacearum]|uniref:Uncharacterized protein n=1 Tax=Actinoallomurus liliacearum TaxID=1080073 RepID=A0ABP8TJC9_9ACTN
MVPALTDTDAGANAKPLIDTEFAATGAAAGAAPEPEPPCIRIPGMAPAGALARGADRAAGELMVSCPQPQAAGRSIPPTAMSAAGHGRPRARDMRFIGIPPVPRGRR